MQSVPLQHWFQMKELAGDPVKTIEAIDRLQRARCRSLFPLGGRELDMRLLLHGDPSHHSILEESTVIEAKRLYHRSSR